MLRFDLHRHLEGSHSPRALATVAREHDVRDALLFDGATGRFRSEEEIASQLTMKRGDDFYSRINLARVAYVSASAIGRLAELAFEEVCAESDRAEMRVSLFSMTRTLFGPSWRDVTPTAFATRATEVLVAILDARDRVAARFARPLPIRVGFSRTFESAPHYRAMADALVEHRRALCGLDVLGIVATGDREPLPAELVAILERLRPHVPDLTVHAGEFEGAASVKRTLELGPRGIGHGVRSLESPALLDELAQRGVTLEVCPMSNELLIEDTIRSLEAAHEKRHPLVALQHAHVHCVLGSDDPVIFGSSTDREHEEARRVGADLARLEADGRRRWSEITGELLPR